MGDLLEGQAPQLFLAVADDRAERRVDADPAAVRRHQGDPDAGDVEDAAKARLAGAQHGAGLLQLLARHRQAFAVMHFLGQDGRQVVQHLRFLPAHFARFRVEGAQGADRQPGGSADRHPGVEADVGRTVDQRVVAEALILRRVVHHQRPRHADRMRAERVLARGLLRLQPDARLEPLAVGIHQREQGHRHIQQAAGQPGDAVEHRLGRGVQQGQGVEQRQAVQFVGRQRGGGHSVVRSNVRRYEHVTRSGRDCNRFAIAYA